MCFCDRHSYRADRLDWSVYAGADVVAASSRALRLEPQREYLRRLLYPSEDVGTKRFKPLSVGNRRGERGRNEDLAAERFAQRFDARNLVDRRADDCEVKAIDGADIAIEDLADVEGEIDDGNGLPYPGSIGVKSVDAPHRFGGGVKRAATGFTARRAHQGKAREHAIAKELQHLSPAWPQRGRQRLEDVVEHFNKNRPRRRIG
jgi:hypothetical protein